MVWDTNMYWVPLERPKWKHDIHGKSWCCGDWEQGSDLIQYIWLSLVGKGVALRGNAEGNHMPNLLSSWALLVLLWLWCRLWHNLCLIILSSSRTSMVTLQWLVNWNVPALAPLATPDVHFNSFIKKQLNILGMWHTCGQAEISGPTLFVDVQLRHHKQHPPICLFPRLILARAMGGWSLDQLTWERGHPEWHSISRAPYSHTDTDTH